MKDTKTKRWLAMFVVALAIAGTFASVASSKSHLYRGLEPLTPPTNTIVRSAEFTKMAQASVLTAPTTTEPTVDFTKVAEENSERLLKVTGKDVAAGSVAPRTELPEPRTHQLQKSNLPGPKISKRETRLQKPVTSDPEPKIKIIK